MTPAPKPAPKPVKPRKGIPRKTYLKKSEKPIRKVNPEAKARRSKKYKAFLSSAMWKRLRRDALARAGNRCTKQRLVYHPIMRWIIGRCPETTRLTVDHLTYARFGGNELPEDLKVLCHGCHMTRHALEGKRIA